MDEKAQVWKYLLKLNEAHLGRTYNGTVISCAHFLPLPCLPFEETPKAAKAMGCEDIEDQIFQLRSKAHVYGHSLVRAAEAHGGVITSTTPMCSLALKMCEKLRQHSSAFSMAKRALYMKRKHLLRHAARMSS